MRRYLTCILAIIVLTITSGCHLFLEQLVGIKINRTIRQAVDVPSLNSHCIRSALEKNTSVLKLSYKETDQRKSYFYSLNEDKADKRAVVITESNDKTFFRISHYASFLRKRPLSIRHREAEKKKIRLLSNDIGNSCGVKFTIFDDEKTIAERNQSTMTF